MSDIILKTNETRERIYTATAGQTDFSVPFRYESAAEMGVIVIDAEGVATEPDFSMVPSGAYGTEDQPGILRLAEPLEGGERVEVYGVTPLGRVMSLAAAQGNPSTKLNSEYSNLQKQLQEIARRAQRSVAARRGETLPDMPAKASILGQIMYLNEVYGEEYWATLSAPSVAVLASLADEIAQLALLSQDLQTLGNLGVQIDLLGNAAGAMVALYEALLAGDLSGVNVVLTAPFTALTDTPASYTGRKGHQLRVNGSETAIEAINPLARDAAVYVDSVAGSDLSAGTSAAPVRTIAKALDLIQGVVRPEIYLKRGGIWREQFQIPDNAYVTAWGETGALPKVSGADLLPNASFSLESGNVYRISLPSIATTNNPYVGGGGGTNNSDVLMVWENNTRLGETFLKKTSIAQVEAAPGSFWWDAGNKILYVHATDSSDVTANGRVYEASVRTLCVHGGDGFLVERIHAEKAGAKTVNGQQGYAILGFKSGHYRNCRAWYGWNHCYGVANDQAAGPLIFENIDGFDAERISSGAGPPTVFVAFKSSPAPSRVIIRNCSARQPTKWVGAGSYGEMGFFAHGPSIHAEWEGMNYAENIRYGAQLIRDAGSSRSLHRVSGCWLFKACNTGMLSTEPGIDFEIYGDACANELISVRGEGCRVRGKAVDCKNGVSGFSSGAPLNVVVDGMDILSRVAAVAQNDSTGIVASASAVTFKVRRSLFHNLGCALRGVASDAFTDSDLNHFSNNVRVFSDMGAPVSPTFGTTLSAWQGAAGEDAGSTEGALTLREYDYRLPQFFGVSDA